MPRRQVAHTPAPMSRERGLPPPPESIPQPFVYPGSSANPTTSTARRNPPHLPEGSPPGPVRVPPPQHCEYTLHVFDVCMMRAIESREFLVPDPGVLQSRQPTTYAYTQPSQPPPVPQSTYPHFNAPAHARAPTHSYSSSPPHPSSHLPQPGPVSPPLFSIPSVSGAYAPTHISVPEPPSPSMTQRATSMPIPGQVNYAQSVPYQNIPTSGIAQQSSHSGVRMPGSDRSVSGGWSYRA